MNKLTNNDGLKISTEEIVKLYGTNPEFKTWLDTIIPAVGTEGDPYGFGDIETQTEFEGDLMLKNMGDGGISSIKTEMCHGDGFEIAQGVGLNGHFTF